MIQNRIAPVVKQRLTKEQAGFWPVKSCTSQLLNLTQHIEDCFQRGMLTDAALVDLSAAYDTVNDIILIYKLYNITKESPLCGSKRHNLQAVELSQRTQAAVQTVSNLPAPSNGGPIYHFFGHVRSCGPVWLALLLTKAGDVEPNPGTTTLNKKVWIW